MGAKTEAMLAGMGVQRVGEIAAFDRAVLIQRFGKGGDHLWQLAHGIDDRPVLPEEGYKSIGHETTFERDTSDIQLLHDTLLELTEKMTRRLRANGARGRTITVKLREADFSTVTRRETLPKAYDTTEKVFPVAWKLLQLLLRPGRLVRLIGVTASNLASGEEEGQLELFAPAPGKERSLAKALDSIARRYGDDAITRAALVSSRDKKKVPPSEV